MEIRFLFVGRAKAAYIEAGVADYVSRLGRYLKAEVRLIKAAPHRKGQGEAQALGAEAARLEAHLSDVDYVICLERGGQPLSSEGLARTIEGLMLRGVKRVAFVVGGMAGLPAQIAARANLLLSLGPMTFTHEMARLILVEQIYRALTIRAGEPYHK